MAFFDCMSCGACCCNTARNRALGTHAYIEVSREDRLYREDRALLRTLATRNDQGTYHLRLVEQEERCVALEGDLGENVRCRIYPLRPSGCRAVESGDEECLKARRQFGFSTRWPPDDDDDAEGDAEETP